MTRPPRTPRTDAHERGFVLVGVVMIVLALTILGLSLFSLSGYEAQFLGDSMRESQVFYDAMSGIERVKFGLEATDDLGEAARHLPPGIVAARAMQHGDSTGAVDWTDVSTDGYIQIRVVAQTGGVTRVFQASYTPSKARSLYRDVLATSGRAAVDTTHFSLSVFGSVRQNDSDASVWFDSRLGGVHPFLGGGVPATEAGEFIAVHSAEATPLSPQSSNHYDLNVPADTTLFFVGPNAPGDGFGFDDDKSADVRVSVGDGTAIWLLPGGAFFEDRFLVSGSRTARLIVVAGTSVDTTFRHESGARTGLWLHGGVDSRVPLILASSGTVALSQDHGVDIDQTCDYISIFAGGIYLRGPNGTGHMTLVHNPVMDPAVIDPLYDKGYLPNTISGRGRAFTLVAGSWQDLSASLGE